VPFELRRHSSHILRKGLRVNESERPGGVGDRLLKRKRTLPHWQLGGCTYFLTFRSARGVLPLKALVITREKILEDRGTRYDMAFGVMMPDHVHLLMRPREREPGIWWDLATIMQGIKGASARRINQALETRGQVWQKESFDRIVRDDAEFQEKWLYMYENPLRAGLVDDPDRYEYFIEPE
jgi:REP element-mobilizing transposase RayT